jgi:hypothetical protein
MANDTPDIPDEFKAWAKMGDIHGVPDSLSIELLQELKLWIDAGQVQVEGGNQKYFDILETQYPIGLNRIDWRGVREHLSFDVFPIRKEPMAGDETEQRLASCLNMLLEWLKSSGIALQEQVVWVGDVSNISLHTTIETLLELYPLLFSWPQHSYVLPLTGQWCLNYTMEGQLFFGRAENAIAHGCVNLDAAS